jgi:hypothetical protein
MAREVSSVVIGVAMAVEKLKELCTAIRSERDMEKFNELLGEIAKTLEAQKKDAIDLYQAHIAERRLERTKQ